MGRPRQGLFSFHWTTEAEIWGPLPPAHRSFADSSGNISGLILCTGATICPNFLFFLFFIYFLIFSFCYSFLIFLSFLFLFIHIFLSFSSYLFLFLFFLFFTYFSSSSYSSFLIFESVCCITDMHFNFIYVFKVLKNAVCGKICLFLSWQNTYPSSRGVFWGGQAFFDPFGVKINVYTGETILFFSSYLFLLFLFFSYCILPLLILIFLYLNCLLYCRHAY